MATNELMHYPTNNFTEFAEILLKTVYKHAAK
jgi:hypothetical protein